MPFDGMMRGRLSSGSLVIVLATLLTVPAGATFDWAAADPPVADAPLRAPAEEPVTAIVAWGPGLGVHGSAGVPAVLDQVTLTHRFETFPGVVVQATPSMLASLAEAPGITYVEEDKPVAFSLDSATEASRARSVYQGGDGLDPIVDDQGRALDGSGVGIAVVDSGLDGTHPDFLADGKVAGNFLATLAGVVPGGIYTERLSTHGTRLAGIAAGTGAASGGQYAGAAPGATLYSFSILNAQDYRATPAGQNAPTSGSTVSAAVALDWILAHGDEQDPPIRVVSNSWYCAWFSCSLADPSHTHIKLASALAENGTVVTWATGNFGKASRASLHTVPEARNPTPGIIGVASYDDGDVGVRAGCTADISARGRADLPETWPDLAAPGTFVTTTNALFLNTDARVHDARRAYDRAEGTSAATAHMAGIAALMLQANPTLTPGEVEYLLKSTATKLDEERCGIEYVRADPSHLWDGANYASGHGLVDARSAVEAALVFTGIPEAPTEGPEPIPENFAPAQDGVVPSERFYLAGEDGLVTERDFGDGHSSGVLGPTDEVTFVTAPFNDKVVFDGFDTSLWADIHLVTPVTRFQQGGFTPGGLWATLEHVDADGTVQASLTDLSGFTSSAAGVPSEHDLIGLTDEPITVEPGERLRLRVGIEDPGAAWELPELVLHWSLHWGSADTPSSIAIGDHLEHTPPGGYADCRRNAPADCAWMDEDHPAPPFKCEATGSFKLTWTGPPGSRAVLACYDAVAVCEIPGDAGDPWQTCESYTQRMGASVLTRETVCLFETPDGAADGVGKCEVIRDD